MYLTGTGSSTAMRIAAYQAQALMAVDQSTARIASSRRFTSFAEDSVAATVEISLRTQRGAATLYLRATQDAVTTADAASAGLQTASDLLIELRNDVLALNAADPASVSAVQEQVDTLTAELTRISATTTAADGTKLLDGSIASTPLSFKVAGTGSASDDVQLTAIAVDAAHLGTGPLKLDSIDFTAGSPTTQSDALAAIDAAQAAVTASLASTGGVSAAMGYHASAIGSQISGLDSGLDTISGLDVAQETVTLTAAQLRAEAASAMLAQVNNLQLSMVRQLLMAP
ncbi:flagellin [Actinoplanes oblitus]|uniref:Flagellin n=1 Tax=Actinoplanes oblitus TaxID=3040509 RepID=A0ABY8WUU9_9ACTN|nr:flagellin [Actinoplanes oblitus]WIN00514.1 flagellin [Actinoplanes oblitus]